MISTIHVFSKKLILASLESTTRNWKYYIILFYFCEIFLMNIFYNFKNLQINFKILIITKTCKKKCKLRPMNLSSLSSPDNFIYMISIYQ